MVVVVQVVAVVHGKGTPGRRAMAGGIFFLFVVIFVVLNRTLRRYVDDGGGGFVFVFVLCVLSV